MARKKDYGSIDLDLTDAQLRKISKGGAIIVKPGMFKKGHPIRVSAAQHRKMMTAVRKGKGYKLTMAPDEMEANEVEMEGGRINWRAIGRTIRRGAETAAKFYREKVRPEVGPKIRKAVKEAIEKGIPTLAEAGLTALGQPELAAIVGPAAKKLGEDVAGPATEKLSKLTGAFGVKKGKKKGGKKKQPSMIKQIQDMEYPDILPYKAEVQDNYSLFLSPNAPGMNPTLPMPDNSLPIMPDPHVRRLYAKGRGLTLTGSGLRLKGGAGMDPGGQFRLGLPMDPVLPQRDNSTIY